ncbi:hypothetical protein PR202_gb26009 [Eleusine coracana subsp. coracana]|uniref:Reverse transcriptase n=1 Tax=Eleusine coracana subsp. coracana TaxID=191504 RepID=A0AAV5FQR5_ELECO|nr:hypothetical protein PR202_gb26009 [Eleusine coracana subsp. coracana]
MLKNSGPNFIARGLRVSRHAPWISHLLFADDCLIFSEATDRSAQRVASILDDYNKASGQLVNKQKSAIFFSPNTDDEVKGSIHSILDISMEALGERYLGLPTAVGRSMNGVFDYVGDRVRNSVNGWAERQMSCAAREVQLKSIAQAVPTYSMSCFKLPAKLCQRITTYISNYWWGSSLDNHRIHWLQWPKLTKAKGNGGMGFREMKLFNQALLGKQGWRLVTNPDSLCSKVLKGKYYPNSDFLSATRRKRSTVTWRAILHGRDILSSGMIKRIGSGVSVDVWNDHWIPSNVSMKPIGRLDTASANTVADLIKQREREWDVDKLKENFTPLDIDGILKIKLSNNLMEDIRAWAYEKNGVYSVRSAYRLLKDMQIAEKDYAENSPASSEGPGQWWKHLWKMKVPPKVRIFWWRAIHEFLPAKSILSQRHIAKESFCPDCGNELESIYHTMFECTYAFRFWECIKDLTSIKPPLLHPDTWAKDLLVGQVCKPDDKALIACCCWSLWTGRNSRRHGNETWSPYKAAKFVTRMVDDVFQIHQNEPPKEKVIIGWRPPEVGYLKLNTDGAFYMMSSLGGTGAVLRNHEGTLVRAQARWYDHMEDASFAEALAVRDGMIMAKESGANRIIVESDCAVVLNMMATQERARSAISSIWHDVQELNTCFLSLNFCYTNRKANMAAHGCAKFATPGNAACNWESVAPDFLKYALTKDCNSNCEII